MNKRIEVVEMCDSLARHVFSLTSSALPAASWSGIVVRGHRTNKRSIWTVDEFTYRPELRVDVSAKVLIDAVSQLYQLPINGHTEIQAWLESVKKCHVPHLAKCVISS